MNRTSVPNSVPKGMSLVTLASGPVVVWRWRNMVAWALLPMGLMSLGIAIMVARAMAFLPWNDPLQLIPVCLAAAAIVIGYVIARRMFNVTKLIIAPPHITIAQGPLPSWKSFEVATETIRKIEVRPYTWRSKGRTLICYHLWAVQGEGVETCLLERDATEEQMRFARDEIHTALNLGEVSAKG